MLSDYQTPLLLVALVLLQTRRTCSSWASSALACATGQRQCSRCMVQADRQKCRSTYYFMSRFVCAKAFVRQVGVRPDKLYALAKHYKTNGPVPRQLRAGGRKNNTASLALVDTERVFHFIKQSAEDHAVCLPGRVPGF